MPFIWEELGSVGYMCLTSPHFYCPIILLPTISFITPQNPTLGKNWESLDATIFYASSSF